MQFEWIDFYSEFATKLLSFKNDRKLLIDKISAVYAAIDMKVPKLESGDVIIDIDPFTVFGLFNKGITNANRITIIGSIAREFDIKAMVPQNFDGIPVLNNLQAVFYGFKDDREEDDIDNLWKVFEAALALADEDNEENRTEFSKWYDLVHDQYCIRWNLTMGLYWIRPYCFINLDSRNRWFITNVENMPAEFVVAVKPKINKFPKAADYLYIKDACTIALNEGNYNYKNYSELSYYAWMISEQVSQQTVAATSKKSSKAAFLHWFKPLIKALRDLGGSATPNVARKKIIENEKLSEEEVNITRGKNNVNKFENEVAFARNYLVNAGYIDKSVYGVWTLTEAGKMVDMTEELASDIFKRVVSENKNKGEYEFILDMIRDENPAPSKKDKNKYTKEEFLKDVYITEAKYDRLVSVLKKKKNIIMQGAPGVGKTFAAKRLAYSIMGEVDEDRIEFVQFHQNYSYEDFVMGYKPVGDGFELKYGIFYRFCQKAANHPDQDYFFIIDEINRGNMSKIFGELLMLIEADYRDKRATLAYNGLSFSVPKRLHIIGMMNTADRSLAMIDYALRRRFSFFDMEPGFDSEGFINYQKGFANDTFNTLIERIKDLNREIMQDKSLGKGFCIGHSYFCNADKCTDEWMKDVVDYDILPMLSEYWFDDSAKLQRWENILHGVFQ